MQNFRNNFVELDWNNMPTLSPGNYAMRGVPSAYYDQFTHHGAAGGGDIADQFGSMSLRRRRRYR